MAFAGLIGEIPLGQDGLTGNKNLTQVSLGSLIIADNITFENGTLQKEGGAIKYNSSAITGAYSIIGGWDWFPSSGTQRSIIVTSNGTVLRDTGGGTFGTTLVSGLTVSNITPIFVEGGKETATAARDLFLFTEKNQVKILQDDGVTMSNITTPAADWTGSSFPLTGCIHEGRLWGFMGHRAYYSRTTNHQDFTGSGAGSINVFPGEGEEIVGALSFKGLLVVWKYPRGIYLIDTSNSDITLWRVTRHSEKIGSAGPQCMVPIDDDILFIDTHGDVHLISAITEFGNLGSQNVSKPQRIDVKIREEYNVTRLWNARGVFHISKNEVHFACAALNSSVNDRRIVVDLNRPDFKRFRESSRDTLESLWLRMNTLGIQTLAGGDNAGFVWLLDQTARSKDSTGYSAQFQTAHIDLSHVDPKLAFKKKNGAFLELVIEPKGIWNLSIDVYWDGELSETLLFSMGSTGAVVGTFVIGTDLLARERIQTVKNILNGSGRYLSIAGRNSGAGEDFSIGKMFVYFTESTED